MMIIDHPGSPFGELVLQVLVVDAAISLGARVPALQGARDGRCVLFEYHAYMI
jgi:hypothetical protein